MAYDKLKRLSREQRLKIYKEALRTFEIMAAKSQHKEHVTGMCEHISKAAKRWFNKQGYVWDLSIERKNYPEYFSYKPTTGWKENYAYWWSTKTPSGRERRLKVLRAIAAGQDKSMTGPLP